MAYQSLYRKYRPQTFADVVGQGHVVRTLQNALTSGRVAHGYLFTGTRGTAKTTVARLLAKTLNCESSPHPVAEPCNVCNACLTITAGSAVDVIEMDAASHRGVSDIEEVRRAVGYGPMQLRYKVFIIDEAHQLSSDAKDAFLKTLEEPPANVVFILATTEPQAIPITIRSRCQQFDFKRGSMTEITGRLRYVLECEGVSYTPDAVSLVARGAEGSYRDSLSLLEQVLAFSPTQVTAGDVETVLGSLDAEMLSKVVVAVSERNAPEAFALAGQILDAGKEARTLLRTLSLHFRDLLLVSVGGPAVSAEMTPDEVRRLQTESRLFTPEQMMAAMDVLNEAGGETRWNNQHRLLTELTFLKLMHLGAGQGDGRIYTTAPIVFSESVLQVPVEGAKLVSTVAPLPPASCPLSPPTGGEGAGGRGATTDAVDAAYFAADSVDENEADDLDDENDFVPLGDSDVPDDESFTAPSIAARAPVEALPEPVTEERTAPAEPEEWELFAPDPQPGPGLFDDAPPGAVAPLPFAPRPPQAGGGGQLPAGGQDGRGQTSESQPESPPHFTPRERNPPPPALSLQKNVEEPQAPQTPPAAVSSTSDDEPNASEPAVSLQQVKNVWGNFLRQTERFSRMTFMYLQQAEPTQVAGGRTVVLMIRYRPYYEMLLDKPKAQAFIKKLLARVLERETVGLRLELDPAQVVPAKRLRVAEPDKTRRYDRMAAMDALDTPAYPDVPAPVPASGASFGWSGGNAPPEPALQSGGTVRELPVRGAPPVVAAAVTAPAFGDATTAPAPRERPFLVRETNAAPLQRTAAATASAEEKRQIARAEPLVQEILQHFGGDVVLD